MGGGARREMEERRPAGEGSSGVGEQQFLLFPSLILPFPFSGSLSPTVKAQHLRRHNYCYGEDERSERLVKEKEMLQRGGRTS